MNTELNIVSDSPAASGTLFEGFEFKIYIDTLFNTLTHKKTNTPLVISVEGDWGSGKTTLMRCLQDKLIRLESADEQASNCRVCKTVWFNAWKYNEENELLSALIHEIIKSMMADSKAKGIIASIIKETSVSNTVKGILQYFSFSGVNPSDFLDNSPHKQNLGYFYHFEKLLKILVKLYTLRITFEQVKSLLSEKQDIPVEAITDDEQHSDKPILVIFIDDLDRCAKEKIVKILETVKLFLDFSGCAIVMGMSPIVVSNAIAEKTEESPLQYLEKIIQLRCALPVFHPQQLKEFTEKCIGKYTFAANDEKLSPQKIAELIALSAETPRQCKQFLNNANLLFNTLRGRKDTKDAANDKLDDEVKKFHEDDRRRYKLIMLANENVRTNLYNFLTNNKTESEIDDIYLGQLLPFGQDSDSLKIKLQNIIKKANSEIDSIRENLTFLHFLAFYLLQEKMNRIFHDRKSPQDLDHLYSIYLRTPDFWQDLQRSFIDDRLVFDDNHKKIIEFAKKQISELRQLVFLLPADEKSLSTLIHQGLRLIPAKEVMLTTTSPETAASPATEKTAAAINQYDSMVPVAKDFEIDKYPVTNLRYMQFLNGLRQKGHDNLIKNYLKGPFSKISVKPDALTIVPGYENHPVTGVTWEGAIDFAKWDNNKQLPTVKQWQQAFGEKKYPYGDTFDPSRCNTEESGMNDTTSVDRFPMGASLLSKACDMSGNVWEWCLDQDPSGDRHRFIAGGSWANSGEAAQKDNLQSFPENRGMANIGFRCVKTVTKNQNEGAKNANNDI